MAIIRRRKNRQSKKDKIIKGLNDEQRNVVEFYRGAALVVAVAGSGKTRALVHRIAYLVDVRGVSPDEILAVTFSKKAADEMNTRLRGLGVSGCRVGTWHSLALEILREETEYGSWEIDSRDRFRGVVKQVLGYKGMDWKYADLTRVISYISLCKCNLAGPDSDRAREIAQEIYDQNPCRQNNPSLLTEAYFLAQEAIEQRRLLTFDDMLFFAWLTLQSDELIRARWSSRYSYVLQDEAQDANLAQIEIASLLARDHGNYMCVGDPGQAIYNFRGSLPEKLLRFEEEWNAHVFRMGKNYRSANEIIDAANNVIDSMSPETHLGVKIECMRGVSNRISDIFIKEYENQDDEGEHIAAEILELHAADFDWKDITVLYRTNAQSRGIEEALISNKIPYVVIGGTNFYNRKEIKDLLSYLRCVVNQDAESFKRCLNSPFRYLGNVFRDRCLSEHRLGETWQDTARRVAESGVGVKYRQKAAVSEWATLLDSIEYGDESNPNYMPASILEMVVKETDYIRFLTRDEGAETVENNRVSNVRELIRAAERFTKVTDFLEYIDKTIVNADNAKRKRSSDCVTLTTIHRSKGLEWPVVFLIGLSEKILPHGKAIDIGEERRLFYVGVTRAMDMLYLSSIQTAALSNGSFSLRPSRFISEAGFLIGGSR